jgi:hypothetical protein
MRTAVGLLWRQVVLVALWVAIGVTPAWALPSCRGLSRTVRLRRPVASWSSFMDLDSILATRWS